MRTSKCWASCVLDLHRSGTPVFMMRSLVKLFSIRLHDNLFSGQIDTSKLIGAVLQFLVANAQEIRWSNVESINCMHDSILRSQQSLSYSRISQHFIEREDSLPCSHEPIADPYSELDESIPCHPITHQFCKLHFIFLPFMTGFTELSPPLRFSYQNFCMHCIAIAMRGIEQLTKLLF
jgi:hypothetical protein